MAPGNLRHAAIAFDTEVVKLASTAAELMDRRLPCEMVQDGPVKEIKKFGHEVDLTTLPIHQSGERDAGPFITAGLSVTKDPDTGRRNVSFHRLQLKGKNKTGALIVPRYTFRNLPMPIATFVKIYGGRKVPRPCSCARRYT